MRPLDIELTEHPAVTLLGHEYADWDVAENCPCENTVVTGFEFEGDGFTIRGALPSLVVKTSLINRYGEIVHHTYHQRDVVNAIRKLWPGVAAHA